MWNMHDATKLFVRVISSFLSMWTIVWLVFVNVRLLFHSLAPSAFGEIKISNTTINSAIVSWNTIAYNDELEKVVVSVSVTNVNTTSVEQRTAAVSLNGRRLHRHTLNGLKTFVKYKVEMTVKNSKGSLMKSASFMTPLPG